MLQESVTLFQSVKKYFYYPRCLRNLRLVVFPGLEVLFILEIVEVARFAHPSWIRIDLGIYVALLAALCSQLSALVRGRWEV